MENKFIGLLREKNGYNPEDTNNLLCSELGLTQNEIVELLDS